MFNIGQEVNTRYGVGTVVCVSSVNPHVYVRLRSRSGIFMLEESDVAAIEEISSDLRDASQSPEEAKTEVKGPDTRSENGGYHADRVDPSASVHFKDHWGGRMKKRSIDKQTPLSILVRNRLAELGMKQSEFCRQNGFDQGLLSKIQSSMITTLSLESTLKLAAGLYLSPRTILEIIGRPEMHSLIVNAYSADSDLPSVTGMADISPAVAEISQMALRAHRMGCNLTPILQQLSSLTVAASRRGEVDAAGANRLIAGEAAG